MKKNKNIKKKYKDLPEEQKQKRRDYQKQYTEKMMDGQKQKIKDYRKEYYILYRKKVRYKRVIYFLVIIKEYK